VALTYIPRTLIHTPTLRFRHNPWCGRTPNIAPFSTPDLARYQKKVQNHQYQYPTATTCNHLTTKMPFDVMTRTVLEHYTAHPPAIEDFWFGPWTAILTTVFPTSQEYIVTPQRRVQEDPESYIPDFIIEVAKMSTAPALTFRTVLVLQVKNTQRWQSTGIEALQRQLNRQTDVAFAGTAHTKLYWIGTIGPHWRYGEREDGQDLRPLIDWHHTTHDLASYNDLRALVDLVSALYVFIFLTQNPILMLIHDAGESVCSLLEFKLATS
jgi:hypothetical protein